MKKKDDQIAHGGHIVWGDVPQRRSIRIIL
jgi:hypothetical protein